MTRKSVGYFEGTDPAVLSSLVCDGYDTIPISNGVDNHGQHIRLLNEETKTDVLIGYLHKIYAPENIKPQAEEMFHHCQEYQIPFLVIVPHGLHKCAQQKFTVFPDVVQLVDPVDVLHVAREILGKTSR